MFSTIWLLYASSNNTVEVIPAVSRVDLCLLRALSIPQLFISFIIVFNLSLEIPSNQLAPLLASIAH